MGSRFRLKIAIVMIVSVIIISFTIATIDHLEYRNLLIENEQEAQKVAKKIIKAINKSIQTESELKGLGITASIGIALEKNGLVDNEQLYKMAEQRKSI